MKNIKSYAAIAALAFALTACGNNADTTTDTDTANTESAEAVEKVGEATAAGYNGDIKVKVTMEGETIKDIEVDHTESEGIGADAVPTLVEDIKKNNGTEGVDNVSGATVTSEALKTAVDDAIKAAK
ncbi:FMN-binding protein [uncultured Anaerococcus sp.]|uniref:FMN-binding protein n=1 Tax=uncultured Anaerococcus sp. TaxID=293428 RepID=UPI00280BBB7E|nr:FMN-binding protein [uncultured Anaerococcus sp.]MDU5149630.1 FMN-binding protein [Anaerococcus prevotii]